MINLMITKSSKEYQGDDANSLEQYVHEYTLTSVTVLVLLLLLLVFC